MTEPRASRPWMPGYGIREPGEGTGLLPWSWAEERLRRAHHYWVATLHPAARPHLMPVWGLWHDGCLWFSSSNTSRKARNLADNPRCAVSTEDAGEPVVLEGTAELVADRDRIAVFADLVDAKYSTSYGADFYDPAVNSVFRLRPETVFGLTLEDFAGSPTRWRFGGT
jgi:nitroimidazol reductase NimA-like FMN-containing flavoprotein (pyridoxamine 5'-phosphate oxidase superfamily)